MRVSCSPSSAWPLDSEIRPAQTCQWKTAARGRGCHLDRHNPRTPIRRVQAIYFAMASAVQPFQKYLSTVLVCRNVQDPWGLWAGESRAASLVVVVCVCLCVHMFFVHGRSRTEDCSCSLWPCRYSCRTRRSMAAGVSPFNCRSPVAQFASRVACCWRASLPHALCFTHGHYYLSLRPPLREAASSSLLAPEHHHHHHHHPLLLLLRRLLRRIPLRSAGTAGPFDTSLSPLPCTHAGPPLNTAIQLPLAASL